MTCRPRRFTLLAIEAIIVAPVLFSCSSGAPSDSSSPSDSKAVIRGTIHFEGSAPDHTQIDMSQEPYCESHYGGEGPKTQHVLVSNGKLQNVFVYIKSGLTETFEAPSKSKQIEQSFCRYHPHVMGIQVGQPLTIVNRDSVLHNINALASKNRGFNISQPQAGMSTTRTFSVPEVMVPVKCDVHDWMNAYIGVVDHPFYSVSAQDGGFVLSGLPPGDYVVETWHERYGTLRKSVSVGAGITVEIDFTYTSEMAGSSVPLGDPVRLH